MDAQIALYIQARGAGDQDTMEAVKTALEMNGVVIEDTPRGVKWKCLDGDRVSAS